MEWFAGRIVVVNAGVARVMVEGHHEVDDNSTGIVRFENGAIGNFSLTFTSQIPWTERLEIFGREASLIVDMLSERPVQMYREKSPSPIPNDQIERSNMAQSVSRPIWEEPFIHHSPVDWKGESMRREVRYFVDCIVENKEPMVTGEHGKRAVYLALCAYKSAREKIEIRV